MYDLKDVADHGDRILAGFKLKGFDGAGTLREVQGLIGRRKHVITELETLRATRNEVSKRLGSVKDKTSPDFQQARERMKTVGESIKALEDQARSIGEDLQQALLSLPNVPHPSCPPGRDERDNVEVRQFGTKPSFDFEPRDHVDVGTAVGVFDFERGAKISGARFTVLSGPGARLERALMNFMLHVQTHEHGYEEKWLPVVVKGSALVGTGQFPKFTEDVFKIEQHQAIHEHNDGNAHDLYLAPTAEVQLTNLHAGEILTGDQLPVAYTAYTPCFRSEAGSYGRDTKGFIRNHQFDKVELVRLVTPESAEAQLELLLHHAEVILQKLHLHYRVVELCTADMGFAHHKTFDIEVWLPSQNTYREVSSCSWFGDFQARRTDLRYRPGPAGSKEKPRFLHTINGSGQALSRTVVAILEQNQRADGSVVVPEALRPFMDNRERLDPVT